MLGRSHAAVIYVLVGMLAPMAFAQQQGGSPAGTPRKQAAPAGKPAPATGQAQGKVVRPAGAVLNAAPKPAAGKPVPAKPAAPKAPAPKVPARTDLLPKALAGPLKGTDFLVFAARNIGSDPHWYANFGYWSEDANKKMWGPEGGRLLKLDLRSGKVTEILADPRGTFRDPTVHYDGSKILFCWRKGGTEHFHLYEVRADGTGLRQVTSGPFDDLEPCYLPNDDIVFVSSRCKRFVSCWYTHVAILYRCGPAGQDIRPISGNIEHDNTPAVMPDGRLLYTRWEYIDRSQVEFHHLWTANPDGTNVQTWFGNLHPGIVMIDARPIPDSPKVAAIFSPGHGIKEHQGPLYVVSPDAGPDAKEAAVKVDAVQGNVHDPYPLSETQFIVARKNEILLVDTEAGGYQVLCTDAQELHEPSALRARPRERVIPDRADPAKPTGRLVLADVHVGRNMTGVQPGEIKKLLVVEPLPKPVNYSGGPEPLTWLGTFNLERVLGTVPVEPDGSAYFELPANRSFLLVALDEKERSVKRMQSFLSVMPGETTSCVGCHEQRNQTAAVKGSACTAAPAGTVARAAAVAPAAPAGAPTLSLGAVQALRRAPSKIQPFDGLPDVISYPRDIQPIWDQHCVRCHDYVAHPDQPPATTPSPHLPIPPSGSVNGPAAGGVVLTGDRGSVYSHSYYALFASNQIADGANGYGNRPPRSMGSAASPLMQKIDGSHYGARLDEKQWRLVWLWIESSATYSGTYAALGNGAVGSAFPPIIRPGAPARPGAEAVLQRKCAGCHTSPEDPQPNKVVLPVRGHARRPGDAAHQRVVYPNDPLARRSSHMLYNYTRPELSIALLAPLAKEAGGWGVCAEKSKSPAPFADTADRDYQHLLALVRRNKTTLDEMKRFDMPGFVPNAGYIREMKRYGILPATFDPAKDPIDPYQTDQAYWRSLWWTGK